MNPSEEKAILYRAILENPADDLARLAYADFLLESGDSVQQAQGEFIQVQIRLSLGCKTCDGSGRNVMSPCPCSLLRNREHELLAGSVGKWKRTLAGEEPQPYYARMLSVGPKPAPFHIDYRRGMVWRVRCTMQAWCEMGPRAVSGHPLERVELYDRAPHHPDPDDLLWWWADGEKTPVLQRNNGNVLFQGLFRCLWPTPAARSSPNVAFKGKPAAVHALSDACLLWATREAGKIGQKANV